MSKFTFTGAGGGGGINEASGNALLPRDEFQTSGNAIYLRQDGGTTVKGHIIPDSDNARGLGNRDGAAYSSGVFGSNVVIGTTLLRTSAGELLIRAATEAGYAPIRASVASGSSSIGSAGRVFASGIPISDYIKTEAQITSLAETFVEGGTANPVSGVHVGAATQMWISGIAVGDRLGAAAAVDLSNVAQNIVPSTSGGYTVGTAAKPWGSGLFNLVVLYDSVTGKAWKLSVDASGVLSTTAA